MPGAADARAAPAALVSRLERLIFGHRRLILVAFALGLSRDLFAEFIFGSRLVQLSVQSGVIGQHSLNLLDRTLHQVCLPSVVSNFRILIATA